MLVRIDTHIRRRLRALMLRQWGYRRHTVRHLIKLGAKPPSAWKVVYGARSSTWRLSHTAVVDRTLPNKMFRERGLVSLLSAWLGRQRVVIAQSRQLSLVFA
jgi:hypothetical protein